MLNLLASRKFDFACTDNYANPGRTLLFLDEPTSGLDGQNSYLIVSFLRKLAATGQAVLCTIHQPSAALFAQFDQLLLLKGGGNTVYCGSFA